ncbi:FGGY-family carbohydrate kinase [Cellulomonas sp. Y8]|uniref:FGGY-family carbohydrate kinase n=1 Tax=Cellulomonas sp. Y8 TaxID=2591145 RepID=UPI003D71B2A8
MLPTITVDVGTTSVKTCLFDADARLLASAAAPTPTRPDPWGEVYDPEALVGVVVAFVRGLDPALRATVQRVAITGVGESGGLVRPDATLASPLVLWHDHRGADRLAGLGPAERTRVYQVTGLPVNANYGLSKIAWAVEHAGTGADGALWLNVAEWLAATMSGERWSERSLASRTMALDLTTRAWSPEVCALLGVDPAVLPPVADATHGAPVTAAFAARAGLPDGVAVHVAGHDHVVGGVGAGLRPGELLNSTGTTEGLLVLADAPRLDAAAQRDKLANGLACAGDASTLFASIPTGGSAFATLRSMLGLPAEDLSARIAVLHDRYVAGELDLDAAPLVLPQFRGSPPPDKDAAARGIVAGLRTDATADDVVLGCFLGMALQYRDVLDLFRVRPERVKVIGPASRNPLWLRLKADLLGTPLSVSGFPEVVSRGAQALASGTTGGWAANDPVDVAVDEARHARLSRWADDVRPRWEHLRAYPW